MTRIAAGDLLFSMHASLMISVAMCIVSPSEQRHAAPRQEALSELAAFETIGKKVVAEHQEFALSFEEQQSSTAAKLLHAVAPTLQDSSEVKQLIDMRVVEELEERLKFFPGLATIQHLLKWSPSVAGPRMGPVKEPLKLRQGRRILSMHDMASGYNEMSDNDYLMLFRSWELVDIFTYFSHVQIAVPPLQWTMVAHQRKRPALGTIMLEGANGQVADIVRNRQEVLDKLVKLVDHYGFDGWFFNMETGEDWPRGDPENFLGELRSRLKKQVGSHAMVIAYPYMPSEPIFNKVDGVFVNYNWDDDKEEVSRLVKSAAGRSTDVYMGMDAFGGRRGNTEPDPFHVSLCAQNDLSIAVFAPGFTLEVQAGRTYSPAAVAYDRRYWGSIGENFGRKVPQSLRSGMTWPLDWRENATETEHAAKLPAKVPADLDEPQDSVVPSLEFGAGATRLADPQKVLLQVDEEGHLPSLPVGVHSKKV